MDANRILSNRVAYSPEELATFDTNIPHTVNDWRRYCYAKAITERLDAHRRLNFDVELCNYVDTRITNMYIARQALKGLLKGRDKLVAYYAGMRDVMQED